MKIIGLHIYGFGQLEDVKIDNLTDFQVFYGENEAGKSTIMAFIHAILFGFPTKQQAELRYEPKHNSKYGGKLTIFTEEMGYTVIERVKGKAAAGDVTVSNEKGEIGGEEQLKKLLSTLDKGLFQAIFSFNLHGLQNIHQMKGEEIGKFLFSAGTLGTDRLSIADQELQKELDSRFKPGGKKPILNEKLTSLNRLNADLKEAAAKNREYERLIGQKSSLEQEMAEMNKQLHDCEEVIAHLNEWKKIEPLVREEQWIKRELGGLGEISFPTRGIERYEKIKPLLAAYEAQILSISERIGQINKDLEAINPQKELFENESEIIAALERYPLYQQLKLQEQQWELKLNEVKDRLAEIREKLHFSSLDEEISSINTNIYMKDKVEKLSRHGQALEELKQQLDRRFSEEKNALEMVEEDVQFIQTKLLPEHERKKMEFEVSEGPDRNNVEVKLQAVREKIELFKSLKQQEKLSAEKQKKQKQIQYFIFTVLLIGLILYGWTTGQWLLLLLGGIGFIASALLLIKQQKKPETNRNDHTLSGLMQEEQKLIQYFETPQFKKMTELQERLVFDNRYREQQGVLRIKLEQQRNQYEKVIKSFEDWELDEAEYKKEIKNIGQLLKIPEYMAAFNLLDTFHLLEQYKSLSREKQQILETVESIKTEQMSISDKLYLLENKFLKEKNTDLERISYLLRNKMKEEQEKRVQWKEKQKKLADLKADLNQIKQEQNHLASELNQLFTEAKVNNEKEYYELGENAAKITKLIGRLEDINKQLPLMDSLEKENYLKIHDCDEIIRKHSQKANTCKLRLIKLQEQQASVKYEIQMLEEGGLYADLLHQFKQKKFELEEDGRDWAVYALAQNILSKTIEKYKSKHLPRMLAKAEQYLSFLTDGNYQRIHIHQAGPGFLIERKDQTIFEANELSQATTEQVYVSIRLALATTLYEKFNFPIIIDDSFVNFDAKRTQKVIGLLGELKQNQILFFTCHEHLLRFFKNEQVLCLENGSVKLPKYAMDNREGAAKIG